VNISKKLRIALVVSARPNFPKVAPLLNLMSWDSDRFDPILVHTGQHYDVNMSDVFFADLGIPEPAHHLSIGSGSQAEVTGKTMIAFEQVLVEDQPDLVVVFGDVNGTLACALAAAKLHVPVAHVEAGLRSRDKLMPEEVNRILTDAVSDLLFTPSRDADENLRGEGVSEERIHFVGNIMVDSLKSAESKLDPNAVLESLGVDGPFAYSTLHRPGNVDELKRLTRCVDCLERVQRLIPVVLALHPRTRNRIEHFGLTERVASLENVRILEPVGYTESLSLQKGSTLVVTDSAGLQEESTVLGKPCLTMRPNTERPVTVNEGTATIVDLDADLVEEKTREVLDGRYKSGRIPEFWDGRTSERIVDILGRRA
jgi:UDP-N-acetylglucosamine 2-epimerase (non-hydrolysing)